MLKERIQEVLEFTKSESPYYKANKGWINQDVFLDLNPSIDKGKKQNEAAKVTFFWAPINSLLSNIFWIIFIGSILVFTSVSFAKGRFDFNLFNNSVIIDIVQVEKNKSQDISGLKSIDSTNSIIQQDLNKKDLSKINQDNSFDDDLIKTETKIINKKIDKEETLIKEIESNKVTKNVKNKKSKSNFI